MSDLKDIFIVGVAGGSGSGKTTFANELKKSLGDSLCDILAQDSYYIDQSDKFDHDGGSVNFDHPDAIDSELLSKHLEALKSMSEINIPIYDFATHKRLQKTTSFKPRKIVLVDGILLYSWPEVTQHFNHKVFVDCPEELRFQRRLKRDVEERGRTPDGVHAQFFKQVKPMHDKFVEPSKKEACDIITEANFDEKLAQWHEFLSSR